MRKTFALIISIVIIQFSNGQDKLLTTAEKSNYESTSTYKDVIQFIESLKKSSDNLRIEKMAQSTEGRDIPLMIIADPLPTSYENLKNDDRIVVYLQANIHAGEVEGKEATQMLARELLANPSSEIMKNGFPVCATSWSIGSKSFITLTFLSKRRM